MAKVADTMPAGAVGQECRAMSVSMSKDESRQRVSRGDSYMTLWKFKPIHNYRHRNGTLDISQVYSLNAYSDEITVVPNTRIGRVIHRFYQFLSRHQRWIAVYDFESLDIREGETFPRWSGSYWWFQPFRLANSFFPRVNGMESRGWPDTLTATE